MRRFGAGLVVLAAATACSGGDTAGERVPVDDLLDLDEPLPDDASGVDLGDLGPDDDLSFCEAFAAVPTYWVDDAVVPVQFWSDAWAGVDDEPAEASKPLAALRDHAQWKLDWNFKRREERPVYDETMARHAVALADAAVRHCPGLPLVPGPAGRADPPGWWADESDAAIRSMCDEDLGELDAAIAAYVSRNGRQPGHIAQVDAEAFLAWAYGDDDADLYVSSDHVGVSSDDGLARAVVVPGGACDR